MIYLLMRLWPWLFAIFLIGGATALWARVDTKRTRIAPWLLWCALAFGVAVVLATLHALQGDAGVWLETALAAFVAYSAGAAVGSLRRGSSFADQDKWSLGLVPAALIWLAAGLIAEPSIEAGVAKNVQTEMDKGPEAPARFIVEGRDVLIDADAPNRDALAKALEKAEGVRLVATTSRFAGEAQTAAAKPSTDAAAPKTPDATQETEAAKTPPQNQTDPQAQKAALAAGEEKPAATAVEERKPAQNLDGGERVKVAAAELKALPRTGQLDIAACQTALSNTLIVEKIKFRIGSATILHASFSTLNRIAALLQRCPSARVEIGGHTDNIGDDEDNQALSQRRAEAVLKRLVSGRVAADRLTAVGYGAKKPVASNDDDDGRAQNRRIELLLK